MEEIPYSQFYTCEYDFQIYNLVRGGLSKGKN